jgi:hypothetical protein
MTDPIDLVQHLSAIDAKIGLVWPPPPPPPPPPSGGPPVLSPTPTPASTIYNLQSAINGAAAGGTIHVPSGRFNQRVSVSKNLTIIFDGPFWLDATGLGVPLQQGAFTVNGAAVNVNRPLRIFNSSGAGLDLVNAHDCTLSGLELDHNAQEGYHAYQAKNVTLKRCFVHHNNPNYANDINWEAGAGKAWNCTAFNFDSCEVSYNGGHAIWYDSGTAGNANCLVTNCRIHHNGRAGILFEVSGGPNRATLNAVYENGWKKLSDRGWCGGIVSSTSRGSEIDHNTLAWNQEGIIVGGQHRSDFPATVINNNAHDNVVAMWPLSPTNTRYALDWYGPSGDAMYASGANNCGSANRFAWHGTPAFGYFWNGDKTLSQFIGTPGGSGSTALSDADVNALLTAAGIPTSPESH